ncbi:50S ribosomal protein L19 [Candidatus Kaiserbacteria bacterium]|nr:50S ribosomal protein L19 [Candidatus Kaiserbacteria bacterium]
MESRRELGIRAGDTVRVWQKIEEKGKTRLQAFEGLVLAQKHGNEAGATFTVRRISGGVGVEKIYPLYSPMIDKIEIVKRSKVRRAKLYHIREKVAREIKRQIRKMQMVDLSTNSDIEDKTKAEADAKADEEAKVTAEAVQDEVKAEESKEVGVEEVKEEVSEETPSTEEAVVEEEPKKE